MRPSQSHLLSYAGFTDTFIGVLCRIVDRSIHTYSMTPTRRTRLGTVIATRVFSVARGRDVVLRIGRPRRSGKDWLCPFRIGTFHVQYAHGIDALQALQLALEGARIIALHWDEELSWFGLPDLGMTRSVPLVLPAQSVRRLNRAIDRELELWGRAVRRRVLAGKSRKAKRASAR